MQVKRERELTKKSQSTKQDFAALETLPEWERPIEVEVVDERGRRTVKESARAFSFWKRYRDAPDDARTHRKVFGDNASELRQAATWGSRFRWQDRLKAKQVADAAADAADRGRRKLARGKRNESRQEKIEDEAWGVGEQLLEKAKQMAQWPLVEVRRKDNGRTTIIMPAKWTLRDAARLAEVGIQLKRVGSGMIDGLLGKKIQPDDHGQPSTDATQSIVGGFTSPRDVIEKVLAKFPSWMLKQAYELVLEREGSAEAQEDGPAYAPNVDGDEASALGEEGAF